MEAVPERRTGVNAQLGTQLHGRDQLPSLRALQVAPNALERSLPDYDMYPLPPAQRNVTLSRRISFVPFVHVLITASGFVLAEISVTPSCKLLIFTILKKHFLDQSIQKICYFDLKTEALITACS